MAKSSWQLTVRPPANHLLAALPPDVFYRVSLALDIIPLKLRQFVHKAGEPIREVYLPGGGFVSIRRVSNPLLVSAIAGRPTC